MQDDNQNPLAGLTDHEKAMIAKAEGQPAPASTPSRPEWLPAKFASAEDMAKAYGELETKLGQKAPPPEATAADPQVTQIETPPAPEAAQKAVTEAGLDFAALTAEFTTGGKLSDESYAKLAEKGISKEIVDGYIAGQQAVSEANTQAIYAAGGGKEAVTAAVRWAGSAASGLTQAERDAFNGAMDRGNLAEVQLAVVGLVSRYKATNGVEPQVTIGGNGGAPSGVNGYASEAEMKAAMRDPRYRSDPAYRDSVYQRVERSTFKF